MPPAWYDGERPIPDQNHDHERAHRADVSEPHRRRVGAGRLRRGLREPQPRRHRRPHRVLRRSPPATDAERAVDAAARAFEPWRLVPAPKRAEILYRAAQLLVERKERLARDMTREMGKVLEETRGDVQEAIDMAFFMAGEGRRLFGQTTPSELPDKFAMSIRQPIGVCGIITPWNFPMAIPSWKILPALVCGNTVVIKPATDHAAVGVELRQGPRGGGAAAGRRQPRDRAAAATSATRCSSRRRSASSRSPARPRSAARSARRRRPTFKQVHLEMGGKNVIIVMDDADLDLAVDGCALGRLRHDRAALHGGEPRGRAPRRSTTSSSTSSSAGAER